MNKSNTNTSSHTNTIESTNSNSNHTNSASSTFISTKQVPKVGVAVTILRDRPKANNSNTNKLSDDRAYKIPSLLNDGDGDDVITEVLLIKRGKEPYKYYWSLPGGGIEYGESFYSAAVREIQEECNIDIEPFEPFYCTEAIINNPNNPQQIDYHYTIVHLLSHKLDEDQYNLIKPLSDVIECRWFTVDEIAELDKFDAKSLPTRESFTKTSKDRVTPFVLETVRRGEMFFRLLTSE